MSGFVNSAQVYARASEYYFLFMPTIEAGRIKGKRFWNVQVRKISVIKENPAQTVMKPTGQTLKKPALPACGRVIAALIIKEQVSLSNPGPPILLFKNQGFGMSQVINELLRKKQQRLLCLRNSASGETRGRNIHRN